jgi:RNA polymerase sigma-70 factor (ECF subfamily)
VTRWSEMFSRDPFGNPEPLIRRVYAYVAYRIGDGPDAEDITSETFERALRYRQSFDAGKGEPVAWLIGIARRRLEERRELAVRDADPPDIAAPGDLEEEAVQRLTLRAALAELGKRDREIIALRYGADLTARQIGSILDMRTNAVEVALHRALERLRPRLQPDESERPPTSELGRAKL